MKINIIYPEMSKKTIQRSHVIKNTRWLFLLAAYLCPVVNLCTGGSAWSVVVVWALWMVWSLALSPDLVEYNRISQTIKTVEYSCIMMVLIDLLLSPGWAAEVVYIVLFSGLILTALLFFTDLDKQRQNMLPMLFLISISLVASVIGLTVWKGKDAWPAILVGVLALAFVLACISVLGGAFFLEYKKRFHTR
jgi:hypothetical protein